MLLSLREGSFAETCSADAQCSSGRCARLLPEGAGACRCFNPCPASPSGWGCSAAGAGALGGGLGLLGVLALLWRLRAGARG